ncbi:protein bric-a-brac 1 isoform X1 [Plutella xylostella]|uniref:protein bric-a-brac 1 isoform X1 n=1 Tax=Plutella xylostella TaxID=51655 RepID=UPI00203304AA|nr:protein bric-a-brac 1 isoform X1 [Plutella xylostella]
MSIQQFCLRWNNHQPNFISVFTTLLNTESLVDVTLAAEGRHLQAHKVVLSACSVYFQTLFTENPSRHPIVILKDVKYSDLRIMVDFMYYGEVNVSQEQLPQVLETAKMLKIKGLTEMPESTSLTRSQGSISEFVSHNDEDQQRLSSSPCNSPSAKRRKFRRLSNGSQQPAMEAAGLEPARQDAVTLSSLPQRRYRDERAVDAQQQVQTEETPNNMHSDDPLLMETNPPGLSQEAGNSSCPRRRLLQRQERLRNSGETPPLRKHASQPLPSTAGPSTSRGSPSQPVLQKHSSHPPMSHSKMSMEQPERSSERLAARGCGSGGSGGGGSGEPQPGPSSRPDAPRISHTPAMRNGPPLSCNFCWNTVDDCGRILRRKTQYHCPECRTNLCIVPCFHQYHDGTPEPAAASARYPTYLRRAARRLAAMRRSMGSLNIATSATAPGPSRAKRPAPVPRRPRPSLDSLLEPRSKYPYTYTIRGRLFCNSCKRIFKKKFGFASHIRAHRRQTEAAALARKQGG